MRSTKQRTLNYAETGSDSDDSNFGSEGEIDDVEEFEEEDAVNDDLEDDEQEEEEMDDEFYEDEVVEEEDKPKKARGKYKQPGVKVLRHTGKQLHVRLRFSDKYIYASLFSDTPTEQPVKEEEEEEEQEEDEDDEEDEVEEEGDMTPEAPKVPKSVMQLIDPRTKAQKLSEEELQLKKAEAARKRKHFIARKLEAEKRETLERLLLKRETKQKSASVGPESDGQRKESKKRVLLKHKALFSWSSKTEGNDGNKRDISYYSMVL